MFRGKFHAPKSETSMGLNEIMAELAIAEGNYREASLQYLQAMKIALLAIEAGDYREASLQSLQARKIALEKHDELYSKYKYCADLVHCIDLGYGE